MIDNAQHRKREDPSARSGQAICPSKKQELVQLAERRASSPVGLSRATVEAQLQNATGPEYWRSLEELAGTPELRLLYLLGLFEHPIGAEVLAVLW